MFEPESSDAISGLPIRLAFDFGVLLHFQSCQIEIFQPKRRSPALSLILFDFLAETIDLSSYVVALAT